MSQSTRAAWIQDSTGVQVKQATGETKGRRDRERDIQMRMQETDKEISR